MLFRDFSSSTYLLLCATVCLLSCYMYNRCINIKEYNVEKVETYSMSINKHTHILAHTRGMLQRDPVCEPQGADESWGRVCDSHSIWCESWQNSANSGNRCQEKLRLTLEAKGVPACTYEGW